MRRRSEKISIAKTNGNRSADTQRRLKMSESQAKGKSRRLTRKVEARMNRKGGIKKKRSMQRLMRRC